MKHVKYIRNLIRKGDIENAIDHLNLLVEVIKRYRDDLALISSKFQNLKTRNRQGTVDNSELDLTQNKIIAAILELLNIVEKQIQSLIFTTPSEGDKIKQTVIRITGNLGNEFASGDNYWILQEINGIYHHTDRPIEIDLAAGTWKQENINLGVKGEWSIIACQISEEVEDNIRHRIENNDWSGFKVLPKGIMKLNSITIIKV